MINNSIEIDGNGNIVIQDSNNSNYTFNVNNSQELFDFLKKFEEKFEELPKKVVSLVLEKLKEDNSYENYALDLINKNTTKENEKYNIALSFAGSERKYAEIISEILNFNGLKIFYDQNEAANLLGKNLIEELAEIYGSKADFCLILVSEEYNKRAYTNFERRIALDKFLLEKPDYILPIKFDDTWIKGLPKSTGYLSIDNYSIIEICEIIIRKFNPEYIENNLLSIPNIDKLLNIERGKPSDREIKILTAFHSVKEIFTQYRFYALEKNGEGILSLMTISTIKWYNDICEKIKVLSKEGIVKSSFVEQFIILRTRHVMTKDEIKTLTGEKLIIKAVEENTLGHVSMSMTVFTKVEIISDTTLNAFYRMDGVSTKENSIPFLKENNKWKMDISSKMNAAYQTLVALAESYDMSINEFVETTLKNVAGIDNIQHLYEPVI